MKKKGWVEHALDRLSKGLQYGTPFMKSMEMCGVADNISHILSKSIESWQTIFMSGNEQLARVSIWEEIFQGDTLSLLLLVIGLLPFSHTLRKVNAGYQAAKDQHKKIIHVHFMDDLKLYGNNKKEAERLTNTIFEPFRRILLWILVSASVNMSQ